MRTTLAQKESEMEQRDQARIAEFQAYLAVVSVSCDVTRA